MKNFLIDSPIFSRPKPVWQPVVSFFVAITGIFWLGQSLRAIAFLFWWEVVLMVGVAILRMLFALDGRPFLDTILQKIGLLIGSVVLGGMLIALAIAFTLPAAEGGSNGADTFAKISSQTRVMSLAYAVGLVVHFFANGRFRKANPAGEFFGTFAHLMILLAFLMVLTMHFIPSQPGLDQAKWTAVAIVFVKLVVDWAFSGLGNPFKKLFQEPGRPPE